MSDFNLGTVTAYGYAKDKGYTGTEDEFAELMASYADVAEQAAESATQAAASATTATTKAGEASTSATTATNKATEATTAATTATGKATEAAGSATTATTKAGEASTSATNAAASATRAQEILDSIPADYSQLSEDVDTLKDGLSYSDRMLDLYSGFKPIYFENGYYYTTPSVGSASVRTASTNYIGAKGQVSEGDTVTFYIINNNVDTSNMASCALLDANDNVIAKYRMISGGTIKIPSGVSSIVINNRISLLHSGYYAYVSSGQTRNLWIYGNTLSFTVAKTVTVNIPKGTYVFSADVVSQINGAEPEGYTARIEWMSGETQELMTTINRNCRGSVRVVFEHDIDSVKFYASNTSSHSSGVSSEWTNIQLESGDFLTPYISPYWIGTVPELQNAVDMFQMDDFVITGSATRTYNFVRGYDDSDNVIIEVESKYTGTPATDYTFPQLRLYYSTSDQGTCPYVIGEYGEFRKQVFRLPPFPDYQTGSYINKMSLQFIVPANITLTIKHLTVRYGNEMCRPVESGWKMDTHGAFMFYPSHTYPAAFAAQKCGATRFITIPKCSSDGVWFAYHDDTFDLASTVLRNADGTAIESSVYDGLPFSQIPWTYLKDLTVSKANSCGAFDGVKLMLIDDFFALCNKTGMKPMLSIHPRPVTGEVESLYALSKKMGVLDKLTFKPSSVESFNDIFSIFGEEVESYGLITSRSAHSNADVQALITALDSKNIDTSKVRCFIELWIDYATAEQVEMILSAGYNASLATISHTDPAGVTSGGVSGSDIMYWTEQGVTEFCDNTNSSLGLCW